MLNQQVVDEEEDRLREAAAQLPDSERKSFYRALSRELRDPDTYATLNWFFLAGLHHFYLGRWGRGALNLLAFLAGTALIISGQFAFGFVLILGVSLVELWALFRAQIIVQGWNNQIYRRLLHRYGILPPPSPGQPSSSSQRP